MKTNIKQHSAQPLTHNGAPAVRIDAEKQLRRAVMTGLLWEDTYYESGESIADRIKSLVPNVDPLQVGSMAYEARTIMKLRHMPLLIAREMARHESHREYVADLLEQIVQRADELTEFMAIYQKDGRQPVSAQVKKGLARAYRKFDEYQLAKYNRKEQWKLRDVLRVAHPKPLSHEQEVLWGKVLKDELQTPDTWEVALSSGADKKDTFMRLINEHKLGALALIRNLRNMEQAGVPLDFIEKALDNMDVTRVLPFRFITAARHAPRLEGALERAMFRSVASMEKLPGHTVFLIDNSGSMQSAISNQSEVTRNDAASALAIVGVELSEKATIYGFSDHCTMVPTRHGMALRDVIQKWNAPASTYFGAAVEHVDKHEQYDRLIVISDEQSNDKVPACKGRGYGINVAPYQNGVTYGNTWTHIDGFSEGTLGYISTIEKNLG